jgi:hypothetical protein
VLNKISDLPSVPKNSIIVGIGVKRFDMKAFGNMFAIRGSKRKEIFWPVKIFKG